MNRLIVVLGILVIVSLAAVIVAELSALPAGAPVAMAVLVSSRGPLRGTAAGSVALLALALALGRRRLPRRTAAVPEESVTEAATFSVGAKRALLVVSALMAVVGALGVIGLGVVGLMYFFIGPMAGAISLAFAAGGVITWVQVRRSLARVPSPRMKLPAPWMLGLAFALVVSSGAIMLRTMGGAGVNFAALLLLGAALPPITALAFAGGAVGLPPSSRRVWMAIVGGGTLSIIAAILFEMLLPGVVALLVMPVGELVRELVAIVDQGRFSDLLGSPAAMLLLAQLAIIAPVVEEAVKPIPVLILGRRIQHRRDALLLGMACGAGFAIIENIGYEAAAGGLWAGVAIVRGVGGALHPFGAGLVSLGWYGVAHGEPGAWRRLARSYLIAVGAHALWNGASGIFMLLESTSRGVFGPLNLQGVVIDVGLLALFLAEGVALLWILRQLARSFAPEGTPIPAMPPGRALAAWGLVCLGVLMPVALAGGTAVLQFLSRAVLP